MIETRHGVVKAVAEKERQVTITPSMSSDEKTHSSIYEANLAMSVEERSIQHDVSGDTSRMRDCI